MRRIPTHEAQRIAQTYGFDEVTILARKVTHNDIPAAKGEFITTYGEGPNHALLVQRFAAMVAKLIGWGYNP